MEVWSTITSSGGTSSFFLEGKPTTNILFILYLEYLSHSCFICISVVANQTYHGFSIQSSLLLKCDIKSYYVSAFIQYTDNLWLVVTNSLYRTKCLTALLTRKLDLMLNIEIWTKWGWDQLSPSPLRNRFTPVGSGYDSRYSAALASNRPEGTKVWFSIIDGVLWQISRLEALDSTISVFE